MSVQPIRAIPVTYRGTRFRSTLEANWAATFDAWDWYWQYEPVAVYVGTVGYLCDFYLPTQRVWCEVKGPHNERLEKAFELAKQLEVDEWNVTNPLVVILRPPGPGDLAVWAAATADQDPVLVLCPECGHLGFMDYAAGWVCRRHCRNGDKSKFWALDGGALYRSGQIDFWRAS